MQLAEHQGLPLHECLARNPARHLRAWVEWWDRELDRPTRADAYAARIAMEVRWASGKEVNPDDFLLKTAKQPQEMTEAELKKAKWRHSQLQMAKWVRAFGVEVKQAEKQ